MQFKVDSFLGNSVDAHQYQHPYRTHTVLAILLTYRAYTAIVDSSLWKCDQRGTAAFDITVRNEYLV